MVDPISAEAFLKQIGQMDGANAQGLATGKVDKSAADDFEDTLGKLINDVDTAQKEADTSLKQLASGEGGNIQEVVLKMEQADVSFKLMLEIRNKLMQAYKEIMSSQS